VIDDASIDNEIIMIITSSNLRPVWEGSGSSKTGSNHGSFKGAASLSEPMSFTNRLAKRLFTKCQREAARGVCALGWARSQCESRFFGLRLLGAKLASSLFKESFQQTRLGELRRGAGAGATGEPFQTAS
jgi:hypothetical protein